MSSREDPRRASAAALSREDRERVSSRGAPQREPALEIGRSVEFITVVEVRQSDPARIGDLITHRQERARRLSDLDGFHGLVMHRSDDGEVVLEYSLWKDDASWRAAQEREPIPPPEENPDIRVYDVIFLFNKDGSASIPIGPATGYVPLINIISTTPAQREQLIGVWKRGTENYWSKIPGAVGAALHASRDGMRLLNYALWESREDWQKSRESAGTNRAGVHGLGTSDPRLYEVVAILEGGSS
jgi:heme-degrading monooxygenase HmoA